VPSLPPGAKIAVIQGPMNEEKPFTVRLKFPANYAIPAHSHPGLEHVTVLSGTFHMGTGDKLDAKQAKALPPGSVAIMQPKTNHFALTKAETVVQLHGMGPWGVNYVNPADDPRKN
jgi:quercetin dioxygenase-like cupin family protein